jgi:aminoglycoside phosphotransferase (APT) family kinase protein
MAEVDEDTLRGALQLKQSTRDPEQVRKVLGSWLGPRVGAGRDLSISPVSSPGGSGVANETLLFDATWSAAGREHHEGFVMRVANSRPLYIESDIEMHAKVYEALADVEGVPVPRVYGYEGDTSLLGAPFFVMERIEGEVPRDLPHWAAEGFIIDASPDRRRKMWDNAVEVLARLHEVDAAKFPFLAPPEGTSGLADDLAFCRRYLDHGSDGTPHDIMERGHEWLVANLPDPQPTAFSWGDARIGNIMFRDDEVVAVFDWDTASMAGPEADLAWWRGMDGEHADLVEGIGSSDELVRRWESLTGRKVQNLEWHDVFTSYRLAVVLLNLFRNMATDGAMPPEDAAHMGRESMYVGILDRQLDALA